MFSHVWSENAALFERLMEIHSNSKPYNTMKLLLGVFTLLTSRFLKSRHFDPTIYTCAKISRSFSFTKLRDFLVGSAHVRSQATVHAFMHAAHAVCMRAEDIPTEVPKVT